MNEIIIMMFERSLVRPKRYLFYNNTVRSSFCTELVYQIYSFSHVKDYKFRVSSLCVVAERERLRIDGAR